MEISAMTIVGSSVQLVPRWWSFKVIFSDSSLLIMAYAYELTSICIWILNCMCDSNRCEGALYLFWKNLGTQKLNATL